MSKFKPIKIYIEKRYILAFRVVMVMIFFPFALDVYEILINEQAMSRDISFVKGEHWGYYATLAKKIALALFFLWLATFGVHEKKSED